jgi:hypothetical protein
MLFMLEAIHDKVFAQLFRQGETPHPEKITATDCD